MTPGVYTQHIWVSYITLVLLPNYSPIPPMEQHARNVGGETLGGTDGDGEAASMNLEHAWQCGGVYIILLVTVYAPLVFCLVAYRLARHPPPLFNDRSIS